MVNVLLLLLILAGPYLGLLAGGIVAYRLARRVNGRLRPVLVVSAVACLVSAGVLWGVWVHPKLVLAYCPQLGLGFVLGAYAVLVIPTAVVSGAAGTLPARVREGALAAAWAVGSVALFALVDLQHVVFCGLGG